MMLLIMENIEIIEEINEGNQNLYLRKISLNDSDFLFESLKEDAISKYLSLGPLVSHSYSKKLIKNYLKFWDKKQQFNYIIEIRNGYNDGNRIRKIGAISMWGLSWLHKRAEIGIWITSKYWNIGFAQKAINLIKIVGFFHLKLNRLEAHIAVENTRSINLFNKCGFVEEGILKQYLNLRGNYHDAVVLSYLKALWTRSKALTNK